MMGLPIWMIFLIVFGIMILAMAIQVVREYERLVVFRLGKHVGARGPGLVLIIPFVERFVKVSTRLIAMDVPPQDVITRDNVSIKVNAVLYFRVIDPNRAVLDVEDFLFATSQIAQTTLRSVLGQAELDELLAQRERINDKLQNIIDTHTDPWGIKVGLVEVKHVDLPPEMQRAMARQAEAERERRAKVIHAEGEFQASAKLREAALVMEGHPMAMQMRFLQTLTDVGAENNSTIVMPVPIELFRPFLNGTPKES